MYKYSETVNVPSFWNMINSNIMHIKNECLITHPKKTYANYIKYLNLLSKCPYSD